MEYLQGYYFCSSPHSSPDNCYDCSHIVCWDKYEGIKIQSTADCIPGNVHSDWARTLDEKRVSIPPSDAEAEKYIKLGFVNSVKEAKTLMARQVRYPVLKNEVVDWLNAHILPSTDRRRADLPDGWVIFSEKVAIDNSNSNFSIFFLRRRDALKFIKTWSTLHKPIRIYRQ